jgi:hypothetical protein
MRLHSGFDLAMNVQELMSNDIASVFRFRRLGAELPRPAV